MSSSSTRGEKTPLVPPVSSASSATPSPRSYSSSGAPSGSSAAAAAPPLSQSSTRTSAPPTSSTSNAQAGVRIGLDVAVVKAQQKWKRLVDINDDNCTAKDMASELRSEFAALQKKSKSQELPSSYRATDIAEGNEDEDERAPDEYDLERGGSELLEAKQTLASGRAQVDVYLIAATFVRDGIHGRKLGCSLDRTSLYLHELFHSGSYRTMYTLVVLINCLLAFAERPGDQNAFLAVDLLCMAVFAVDVLIRWYMSSVETQRKYLTRQPWAVARMVLVLISLVDLATNLLLPQWNAYRYSRALRPFFLITRRRNIRIIFASCVRALREVLIVLLLSFCLIGFFGLLGFLLFSDVSNSLKHTNATYFASLHSSMYTMLLIHNCLPYMVKAMYPYFQVTEWSSLFFVIFVLLTNMFLAKLTIAVSYKSYKQHTEKMLYKRLQKRKAALYAAFDILATDIELVENDDEELRTIPTFLSRSGSTAERHGSSRFFSSSALINTNKRESYNNTMASLTPISKRKISLETWIKLCEYLKPKWTSVESTLVFNTIDVEHIGYVDLGDFYQLCSLISVKLERTKPSTAAAIFQFFVPTIRRHTVRKWQIKMRGYLLYEKIFFGKYPVVVAELVVGVFIMLSVVQAIQVNDMDLAFSVNRSWRVVGFVLLCIFTLEVQLKLFAFGRREFFGRPFCKLDLGIALVGWLFYVMTTVKDPPNVSRVFYDLALATRSLRILKLLNLFPPFHEILWTMQRIMPLVVQLLLVIFSFMYAFAIVTQANYGVALREFPAEKAAQSPNWYAVRQEFQVDTFAETLVTLFGVANLAGWDMIMDAAHAMTSSDATYVFFFSYRIAMANILLPIFVGFLVESFVSNAKSVENTIETYVEAHSTQMRQQQFDEGEMPEAEEEQLALLASKMGDADAAPASGKPSDQPFSPVSASSDGRGAGGLRFRFARSGSLVQGEMFDAVKLSDVSRLKLMVEKKDEEIAKQDADIRKLEGNVLGMQTRLSQSQRIILAYERKMEELSAQLKEAQAHLVHRDHRLPGRQHSSQRQ